MSLDAGSVFTTLGFKVDSAALRAYENDIKRAAAAGEAGEGRLAAASSRLSKARQASELSTKRASLAEAQRAESLAKTEAETVKLETAVRRSGVATKLQAAEIERLARQHAVLSATTEKTARATSALEKASSKAGHNLNTLTTGSAKGAAVGLGALAVGFAYAIKTAGDFEKSMRNVNSIAKLSEPAFRSMSGSVLRLAGKTAQSPKVLAEGLYTLVSSGHNAADSLKILESSAIAATAGITDTDTATKAVSAVLNAYALPASKAAAVSDVLFETVNRGALNFEELAKTIGDSLPVAAAIGVPLKDVGAAISTMTKEGIPAAETTTRIRRAIQSFVKPSKDMTAAIKETGAASGEALIKQKGFQGALEAVIKTTDGSKESIQKLFPDIRGFYGALALTGINAKHAHEDLEAFKNTAGSTQKVFAEQSKSAEFAGKRLSAAFQTAAVEVGSVALPILAEGAEHLVGTLSHLAANGTLTRIGHDAVSVFGELGHAIGDVGGPALQLGTILFNVGAGLSSVTHTLTGLDFAGQLATLAAGFLAFKGASLVVPILARAAIVMRSIRGAAAGASSITEFAGALLSLAGPARLIVGAVTIAAAAFVAFKSGLFSSESAAQQAQHAFEAAARGVDKLREATDKTAQSHFAVERAALQHKRALENLKHVQDEIHNGTLKGSAAWMAEHEALLQVAESADALTNAKGENLREIKKEEQAAQVAQRNNSVLQRQTFEEIGTIEKRLAAARQTHAGHAEEAKILAELTAAHEKYNAQVRATAYYEAQVATAEESRHRVEHGKGQIAAQNAQGVRQLQEQLALAGTKSTIVAKFELEDQGAQAKLGALATKLSQLGQKKTVAQVLTNAPTVAVALRALEAVKAGIKPTKVLSILHNAGSAKQKMVELAAAIGHLHGKNLPISTTAAAAALQVAQLQTAIENLKGKTVTVVANVVNRVLGGPVIPTKHASGRGQGTTEAALVGEGAGAEYVIDGRTGKGGVVTRPTVMGLGPDDYVVPLEDRYRGRALGLFAMLARDLGVEGFKKGKAPKHHKARPVPNAIDPLSLPLSDIESKQQAAHSKYESAAKKVHGLTDKVHKAERSAREAKPGSARQKAQTHVRDLKGELAKAKRSHDYVVEHRHDQEWKRTLHEAKAYQAKIDHETSLANIAANDMRLADGRNDEGGYQAAKGRRSTALKALKGLIAGARAHVKVNSKYFDELTEKIGSTEVEEQSTAGETAQPSEEERTGMTDAQRKELAHLEAGASLAALTAGLDDDKTAAQSLVSFLEGVLSGDQAAVAGDEAIKSVADQLKTARGNLESFSGKGTNENADVQAQLNQEKERRETAERTAQIAEGALSVFSGPGDIGAGGRDAYAAAGGPHITINTLHPADPDTLTAIGRAATAGIGYQGFRRATRLRVGP